MGIVLGGRFEGNHTNGCSGWSWRAGTARFESLSSEQLSLFEGRRRDASAEVDEIRFRRVGGGG
jgi:hypothetical protein